jgi:hypothetical protein
VLLAYDGNEIRQLPESIIILAMCGEADSAFSIVKLYLCTTLFVSKAENSKFNKF